MNVYILGERGSDSPVKVTTIQIYDNIYELGKELINRWATVNAHRTNLGLESYITDSYSSYSLYVNELNKSQKPKKAKRSDLWEAMKREEGLQKEITKAMLKV